jgi:hypothetical protein
MSRIPVRHSAMYAYAYRYGCQGDPGHGHCQRRDHAATAFASEWWRTHNW